MHSVMCLQFTLFNTEDELQVSVVSISIQTFQTFPPAGQIQNAKCDLWSAAQNDFWMSAQISLRRLTSRLLRRKSGSFDISSGLKKVQEKETVRLESTTTWVSTASNCALHFFPHSFQPKINRLPQVKLSLCLLLCLWYIFSIPFRQNISTSRRALSCDWVNMWASIRIISSACCNLINSINKQKSFINTTNFTNKHLGKYCNDFHRPAAVLNQKCELPLAAGNEDFNFNVAALQTNNKVSLTS